MDIKKNLNLQKFISPLIICLILFLLAFFLWDLIAFSIPSTKQALVEGILSEQAPSVFNVLDFGAKGDGTTDDAPAVNALLSSISAGDSVYFPNGRYRLGQNLFPPSDSTVFGAGDAAVLLPDADVLAPVNHPIWVKGQNNVFIHDLQIDCQDPTIAARAGVMLTDGASFVTVQNMYIRRCGQYAIAAGDKRNSPPYFGGLHGIKILNNRVDMTGATYPNAIGIEVLPKGSGPYNSNPGIIIADNSVIADAASNGIKVNNQSGARLTGNYITSRGVSGSVSGINLGTSENSIISGNTVIGGVAGIVISGAIGNVPNGARSHNLSVSDNIVNNSSYAGIWSPDGFDGLTIHQNALSSSGTGGSGIRLNSASSNGNGFSNVVIDLNSIKGFALGVYIPEVAGLNAPGTIIRQNAITSPFGFAIQVNGSDIQVLQNNIIKTGTSGLQITGARAVASNNSITDSNTRGVAGQAGLIFLSGDNSLISGNIVLNSVGGPGLMDWGIVLNKTCNETLTGNNFINMRQGEVRHLNQPAGCPL